MGGRDGKVWSRIDGEEQGEADYTKGGDVTALALLDGPIETHRDGEWLDGHMLAVGSSDGSVAILLRRSVLGRFPLGSAVTALAAAPEGSCGALLVGDQHGCVTYIDPLRGPVLRVAIADTAIIGLVCVGAYVACVAEESAAFVDRDGAVAFSEPLKAATCATALGPDRLAVACMDGRIVRLEVGVREVTSAQVLATIPGMPLRIVLHDAHLWAIGCFDGLHVYDLENSSLSSHPLPDNDWALDMSSNHDTITVLLQNGLVHSPLLENHTKRRHT